jgi:sugar lactone lactonase YvrE
MRIARPVIATFSLLAAVPVPALAAQDASPGIARTLSDDTTFFAEGLDADARTGALYITSLHHRNVFVADASGRLQPLIKPSGAPIGGVFGVALDTRREVAWVAAAPVPFMVPAPGDALVRAELLRITLQDGRITGRWTLGDGTGMPGEIALAPDGSVLVSDGIKGVVHRLRSGADTMEVVRSPLLRSPQGIAVDPSGAVAWIADWSRGIMRWDLQTDIITAVPTAEDTPMLGIDGLRVWHGRLIGVQNGRTPQRVVAIDLSADGRRIERAETLDLPPATGESTVGTIVGDRYFYVSSSQWPFWSEQGARNESAGPLPVVTVREIRLR